MFMWNESWIESQNIQKARELLRGSRDLFVPRSDSFLMNTEKDTHSLIERKYYTTCSGGVQLIVFSIVPGPIGLSQSDCYTEKGEAIWPSRRHKQLYQQSILDKQNNT